MKKFKASRVCLIINITQIIIGAGFLSYSIFYAGSLVINQVLEILSSHGSLALIIEIVFMLPRLFLLAALFFVTFKIGKDIYAERYLISVEITLLSDEIIISSHRKADIVKSDSLMYVLSWHNKLVLIWKVNGVPVTFAIGKRVFGSKSFSEIDAFFSSFTAYSNEILLNKEISKTLNLGNIFRKNHYRP